MCIDIVVRLKEFMKHVGLPSTQFADCAKIARPTISQLLNGRNRKVSNELIAKLHEAFPDLNIMWLMFGDGEMIVEHKQHETPAANLFAAETDDTDIRNELQNTAQWSSAQSESAQLADSQNISRPASIQAEQPSAQSGAQSMRIPVTPNTDMTKRIKSIMVFYTDSSFEIFTPSDL